MLSVVINTRQDLDALAGTTEHEDFMKKLAGSIKRVQDVQTYPEGYGTAEYIGNPVNPIWEEIEDLSVIENFGFTKADFV